MPPARKNDHLRSTWTIKEAAQVAGCGERAIRQGVESGEIPHLKLGGKILLPRVAFQRWVDNAGQIPGPRVMLHAQTGGRQLRAE